MAAKMRLLLDFYDTCGGSATSDGRLRPFDAKPFVRSFSRNPQFGLCLKLTQRCSSD